MWRSLVARSLGVRKVVSSNLAIPIQEVAEYKCFAASFVSIRTDMFRFWCEFDADYLINPVRV